MMIRYPRSTTEDVQTLFHLGAMGSWADGKLVSQFVSDEAGAEVAFRVLVHRHGPMVLSACRRILGDVHAAEDAFQATFLVLVKKARSIQGRESLTGWLYGVAIRVAKKARTQTDRRRVVETSAASHKADQPGDDPDQAEVRSLINEEIRRLPERYREPLLLCYLEGLRHHEIAERLDCPVGTVESRLSRARERLRSRLVLRGLATTAGMLGLILQPSTASASQAVVPLSLVEATVRSAIEFGTHRVAAKVAALTTMTGLGSWLPAGAGARLFSWVALIGVGVAGAGTLWAMKAGAFLENPAVIARPLEPKPRPQPTRPDSAVAVPLTHITIDGKLDDWPTNLEHHPITRWLAGTTIYDPVGPRFAGDLGAWFQVGYDRATSRVYLAVTVRDDDLVALAGDPFHTDAMEVYVEGLFSTRSIPDGKRAASELPVVQYAAVPGPVPAYDDGHDQNPSLVYGNLAKSTTEMASRRDGDQITYEWAIQVFDHYPDQPTRLEPGKRIGFDVVVVDKDRDRSKPTWLYWGPPPTSFKGLDAGILGELILDDAP